MGGVLFGAEARELRVEGRARGWVRGGAAGRPASLIGSSCGPLTPGGRESGVRLV